MGAVDRAPHRQWGSLLGALLGLCRRCHVATLGSRDGGGWVLVLASSFSRIELDAGAALEGSRHDFGREGGPVSWPCSPVVCGGFWAFLLLGEGVWCRVPRRPTLCVR